MFKKGPDIDKKKLLLKASDIKNDSLTRLKYFKTLIEHVDANELPQLFRTHFSFIYHTFIDTFSTFDCNSTQKSDDLDCILFMLEKILIHNSELIKKRWQFYSITFVMQKLLHQNNTFQLRQEGIRLFIIWYQILCDGSNNDLLQSNSDLLKMFVVNSSNAFVTRVHNQSMLEEQVELCKRIMNIYRYMVMKIYMNTSTWEQLLSVMLSVTENLFPIIPPEKKENTIGGRIAPAFFQTFIVSWIRANLYVHISDKMWKDFHRVMKSLVRWTELVEEWSTTMSSLTRVLVKHVYGLNLSELPLDKPQDRRRRQRKIKSFSAAEPNGSDQNSMDTIDGSRKQTQSNRYVRTGSARLPSLAYKDSVTMLTRSNSDGILFSNVKLYNTTLSVDPNSRMKNSIRKIKSEYLVISHNLEESLNQRVNSPNYNDVIDGSSLKDSNLIIESDQALESQQSCKSSSETSKSIKRPDSKASSKTCVLLGGSVRGWTNENAVIMWRRMLGLFGDVNHISDPKNHLVAIKCLSNIVHDFVKARENLGISLDNQSTPEQPKLIPPLTHPIAWLLEATHLPRQFKESRQVAYKLLCVLTIRRHDIELSQQYLVAFYEAIQRGFASPDPSVHEAIISSSTQLLCLGLPASTFLVHGLFEKSRSILLNNDNYQTSTSQSPKDQAVQILGIILALQRSIRKLMVLKPELNNPINLVAPEDTRSKILDTFIACNTRPILLDNQTRTKSLCSMATHVYQELCDKSDCPEIEKLFDILLTELQDISHNDFFRINCDLLRLFTEYAPLLTNRRPVLISSVIQIVCQLIVRLSTSDDNKESIQCLLVCLEDWCIGSGKAFLLRPVEQLADSESCDALPVSASDSLATIVLRSLESVLNDEQFIDDVSHRGNRGSINTSKGSDSHSSGRLSQAKRSNSETFTSGPKERTRTNENVQDRNKQDEMTPTNKNSVAIKLACRVSHLKLVTYLGHFPLKKIGAASMSCCVNEFDYLASEQETTSLNDFSNVFLLAIGETTILSIICPSNNLNSPIQIIVRNQCGKYSWNATCVDLADYTQTKKHEADFIVIDSEAFQEGSRDSMKYDSDFNEDGNSSSSLSSRSSSGRDCIGDLLNQLSLNSSCPSALSSISSNQLMQKKRNSVQSLSNPKFKVAQAEETMLALLTNQRFQELKYCEKSDEFEKVVLNLSGDNRLTVRSNQARSKASQETGEQHVDNIQQQPSPIDRCRQLVQQLGYLSWDKRCKVDSLAKNPRLARELKNLDAQPGRETHKIAVMYVANGQEDKNSILMNSLGSKAFEEFVAGLGWEVNLASHLGFKGGLQASGKGSCETSPYYCNSTTEIMFHVSTRMPIVEPIDDEALNKKLRHLGNDEIHIVWSEHSRDYRRGIIPTEFGDVIIVIYPLLTYFQGHFRIQIISKQDVPLFGPLYDNCIVHQASLAQLVRATAVNASRAQRLRLPYYQPHYEERTRSIGTIVQNHKEKLSFEEFAVQLYNTGSERKIAHQLSSASDCQTAASASAAAACC